MATTPQAWLDEATCFKCFSTGEGTNDLLKIGMLTTWLLELNPMANVSPEALLAAGKCSVCFGQEKLQIMGLLSQISKALNPANDTSASNLLSEGSCYACYGLEGTFELMELGAYKQIVNSL